MDKTLEILGKVVEIIVNRRLMALIAGIAAALLVLSYALPSELVIGGVRPYLFLFASGGAAGLLIHWGFDAEAAVRNVCSRMRMESILEAPDQEAVSVLRRFTDEHTTSLVMWPWERGVEKLVRSGILVCSDADPGNNMRAYSLSADAERYLTQHRGNLRWVDQSKKPN